MLRRLLVAVLVVASLTEGVRAQSPDGTREHPYPIMSKESLVSLANCINYGQCFRYDGGRYYMDPNGAIPAGGASTCFEQTVDIDLEGESWFPIGSSVATGFRGTYLGNGKKIQHLELTASRPALFCYLNGSIEGLTMEDPAFRGTVNYGGALATFVMGGSIKDCHVTGNALVFNGKDCGALIGWVGDPSGAKAGEVTISHCSNGCNITSHYQQESFTDYYNSVAGVVIKAERYHVTHCFNTGNITSTYRPLFQKNTICFAGVVGRGYLPTHPSEITYCYNKGDITAHCGYPDEVCWPFNEKYPATQGKTECIEKK